MHCIFNLFKDFSISRTSYNTRVANYLTILMNGITNAVGKMSDHS